MTIKQQSSWPFHPFLKQFAAHIDAAPKPLRIPVATKTVERCIRLAAKLANHYGMPLSLFEDLVAQEVKREKVGDIQPDEPAAPVAPQVPTDDVISTALASPADVLLASLTLNQGPKKHESN
jgi:hypothetical protein